MHVFAYVFVEKYVVCLRFHPEIVYFHLLSLCTNFQLNQEGLKNASCYLQLVLLSCLRVDLHKSFCMKGDLHDITTKILSPTNGYTLQLLVILINYLSLPCQIFANS